MKSNTVEQYLLDHQLLDEQTLSAAIKAAEQRQQTLIGYLAKRQIASANELAEAASTIFHLPITDIDQYALNKMPINLMPRELMSKHNILPLKQQENHIDLAMIDPGDFRAIEEVKFCTGLHVNVLLVRYDQLFNSTKQIVTQQNTQSLHTLETQSKEIKSNDAFDFSDESEEPLVRFVNDMIETAIRKNASDIHFEMYENYCRVRFRQDGIMHEVAKAPQRIAQRLAARLKIMAELDISEHRLPQDGRCKVRVNENQMDVRVNSCPTLYGEKVVMRLLNSDNMSLAIKELGFSERQQKDFLAGVNKPQGLILVTGPTGSGKTVTLYAALKYLNTVEKNISTVEDPVEINVAGINQVHVNLKAGLTFATALRAFLRQDPDIIMIGEIRDLETAEIAVKAAQTGHLVLSTLHTNSAVEALTRLRNMGVAPYNISSSMTLITAQRLARKLCSHCKEENFLSSTIRQQFALPDDAKIFKAMGCRHCVDGYSGRMALHEVLPITEDFFEAISQEDNRLMLNKIIEQRGILNLQQMAVEKVSQGLTSLEEVCRVINMD